MEDEDRRREEAISAAASLRPNFKPPVHVTQSQLAKFQELHRRRLKIKAKTKFKPKGKDEELDAGVIDKTSKPHETKLNVTQTAADSTISISDGSNIAEASSNFASKKKRQKLHWGLEAKERWERKSNM